jgi:thiol-disulfide isomerase/thioredoxin
MSRSTQNQSRAKPKAKRKQGQQILAMVLIGAGLLILGGLALVLLPKPGSGSASSSEYEDLPSAVPVPVDFPSPELALQDLQGSAVSLADFSGQVVLINNWAIWCPPCKAEMPVLQAYYDEYKNKGFTIVAIEAGAQPADVAAFADQYDLTFPVWPDVDAKSLDTFKNDRLPNSYVIDRNGQVRLAWTGAISRDMLEKHVTPLLEE